MHACSPDVGGRQGGHASANTGDKKNSKCESNWVITNKQQTSQFMRGVLFFVDNKSKSPSSKGYPKKFAC